MSARYLRGLGATSMLIFLERLAADDLPSELAVSAVSLGELSAGVRSAVDAVERARRTERAGSRPDDREYRGGEQAPSLHHEPRRLSRA